MMTKAQAVAATYRQEFWHKSAKNADGTPSRCRVTGACKVWKRSPDRFKLPVKHGMYDSFHITEDNAADWYDPAVETGA